MNEIDTTQQESDNPSVVIEKANPNDAEDVFNVQRLTWLATYPNEQAGITEHYIRVRIEGENGDRIPQKVERWRNRIETTDGSCSVFVARLNDKVVGFVAPGFIDEKRRLGAIYVLPEAQGHGIGSRLLQQAIEWHGQDDDIYLHVASYNHNAINFYKRFGFIETGKDITDEDTQGNQIPEIEMVLKANKSTK